MSSDIVSWSPRKTHKGVGSILGDNSMKIENPNFPGNLKIIDRVPKEPNATGFAKK
jgi:hypothetical protein